MDAEEEDEEAKMDEENDEEEEENDDDGLPLSFASARPPEERKARDAEEV